jgi:acyl-CoA thioester hydrolase
MSEVAWADIAGRIENGEHILPVRIYYEDTDFSGFVYHANYLKFCERARSDCLRLLGISHTELHWHQTDGRLGFVVRRMNCEFRAPARIDDLVIVTTRFASTTGARIVLTQGVRRDHELLFEASVEVALTDAGGRPKRLPATMREAFSRMTVEPE